MVRYISLIQFAWYQFSSFHSKNAYELGNVSLLQRQYSEPDFSLKLSVSYDS